MTAIVLMDVRREFPHTGIGTLIREWRQLAEADAAEGRGRVALLRTGELPYRTPSLRETRGLAVAARRHEASVFHATYPYLAVNRRVRTLLSLHDTLQLTSGRRRAAAAGALLRRNVRLSTAVLTLSEAARRDICEHLAVSSDRVVVTPLGVRAVPEAPSPQPAADAHLLYIGNDKPHKHLTELVIWGGEAASRLGTRLVLVVPAAARRRLEALARGLPVEICSQLPEHDLRRLRGNALAYVSLARGEGFGLPPLEAAAVGVPSLLLDSGAHREVMGEAAVYCELDRDAFMAAADELANAAASLRPVAHARARAWTWEASWASVRAAHARFA